ncbi:MAG: UbiX family flavin prenyltransferase [Candidatus Aenigmarchaeota archaeon]|nr:UbiX family flavin prenyltransferase [Candidatus Aenigmarchaeota archaeon]
MRDASEKERIIVGISGSSCAILGVRFLEVAKKLGLETHLVISETAEKIIEHETGRKVSDVRKLATKAYGYRDLFAAIASGSFQTKGMVIIPCSMKTLAGVASGYSDNLMLRAADVCLKERRKLVLVARETPLSLIHIENMKRVTLAGGVILPPVMTLYAKQKSIEDLTNHVIGKTLDVLGIDNKVYNRWS